ncbi:glycosyltransferase [Actinomadura terrae]|uniref:glycosyltransferase n=1 Tax=Actinomadura terrae TaxID=604353 RepID=UPI001FA6B5CB|nr:nucleotide disphospho-sugar-binding domain-containing protein [Actinomadura terrae]
MSPRRVQVPSLLGDRPRPRIVREKRPERRFLFAVPPLTGHVEPTVAVAAELVRRGHKVAWTGHRTTLEPLLRAGSKIFTSVDPGFGDRLPALREARLRMRGAAAFRFLWEEFVVPLGHAMTPGVGTAIDRFRADIVVADRLVLAAPVAARLRELPWATSAATSAGLARPLAGLPQIEGWVRDQIGAFHRAHGVESPPDPRFSDRLVLVFSTSALVGGSSPFPGHFAFVGPALGRPAPTDFPWEWLDGRPTVLFSLGTGHGPSGERFSEVAADAVRGLDVQAVIAGPVRLADVPDNVLVREHVPQRKLLERLSVVVCHGGHDTVCESLAHGLPLVIAPIRDDQPVIARQVAASGAGVPVRFARVRADELRAALETVLADGPHRAAARRVRDSLAAAGGAAEAADRLEDLA